MVKALFFDFGNVLVLWRDRIEVLREIVQNERGDWGALQKTIVGPASGYSPVLQDTPFIEALDTGAITERQFLEIVCREGKVNISEERFRTLFTAYLRPIPDVVALVAKLAQSYTIVGVTNGDPVGASRIREILAPIPFCAIIASFEVGAKKPDPRIWQAACDAAEVSPHEAVFVDDVEDFVLKACEFGLRGVHFDATTEPLDRLKDGLHGAGVAVG